MDYIVDDLLAFYTMSVVRITLPMRAVLGVLLEHPDQEIFGLEVVKATGLEPGTVYPILQRLRGAGFVVDRWEPAEDAQREGRPPRRFYRLSPEGHACAIHELQKVRDHSGLGRLFTRPDSIPKPEPGAV